MAGVNASGRIVNKAVNRIVRLLRAGKWRERQLSAIEPKRDPACGEEGQSLVEIALSFPVLLGFIFGLIQVCLAFYTYDMVSESARQGSRYAITHGSTCVTGTGSSCTVTAANVNSYVSGLGWPNLAGGTMAVSTVFYPSGADVAPNDYAIVNVVYTFPYKIPFVMNTSLSLTSSSEMYFLQ